jgi:HEAT repeat protein
VRYNKPCRDSMAATLHHLVQIRSQIANEVLAYLDEVATLAGEVPAYYPAHLRSLERGVAAFDEMRQIVKVVEDRKEFDNWRAEEMERRRRSGLVPERLAYVPHSGEPEDEERGGGRTPNGIPHMIVWDEHAGARFRRAVLLGDPGFGKTWLLRYEARRLARYADQQLREHSATVEDIVLPVYVRLSGLNRTSGTMEEAVVKLVGEKRSERFTWLARSKIGAEGAVLLLDGWDEVGRRETLRHRLEVFARRCPQQRMLLASRIVGYGESPIPGAPELELLSFGRRQIEAFVRAWFGDRGGERSTSLLRELEHSYAMRGLARIPLMLALLCRAYEPGGQEFPVQRGELYERCLWGLLRDWKQTKGKAADDVVVKAMLERLQGAAEVLVTEGKQQFTEWELAGAMGFNWNKRPKAAQRYVNELKSDGVLIEASEDGRELLFLHRTFQEYLTARSLAGRGWAAIEELVDRKSWLPEWQEVVVLLAGLLGQSTKGQNDAGSAAKLITLLSDKRKDDVLRHRLALSTLCLAELPKRGGGVPEKVRQRVSAATFRFAWEVMGDEIDVAVHFQGCWPALAKVDGKRVIGELCRRLEEREEWKRARSLGALEAMGPEAAHFSDVVPALLCALHKNDLVGTLFVPRVLGGMGGIPFRDPEVVSALVRSLNEHAGHFVRSGAADTLGSMGGEAASHPEVVPALLRSIEEDQDRLVREAAARALGALGLQAVRHPEVLSALLLALHDQNSTMRGCAADALRALGIEAARNCEVIPSLLRSLREDQEAFVREKAAQALGAFGLDAARHPDVIPALLLSLHEDTVGIGSKGCERAAEALMTLGVDVVLHPDIIPRMLRSLKEDQDQLIRNRAAQSLGALGLQAVRHPEVVPALLRSFYGDEDDDVRRCAMLALKAMSPEVGRHPEVVSALVRSLTEDGSGIAVKAWEKGSMVLRLIGVDAAQRADFACLLADAKVSTWISTVRTTAADALGRMGAHVAHNPEVLSGLLRSLQEDSDYRVRRSAARALGAIGPAVAEHGEIVPALLRTLDEDTNAEVRESAAESLGELGVEAVRHAQVVPTLVGSAVEDGEDSVRSAARRALGVLNRAGVRVFHSRTGILVRSLSDLA